MNIFTGLFAAGKALLGMTSSNKGADNVMKVASGIGNWIDEQKFTEEEKAKFNLTMVEHYAQFMQSTVGENTQRSITRRDIAIWIIRMEIIALMLYGILASLELGASDVWWKIATDSPLGILTLGVGAFFFGTHLVRASKGQ